MSITAGGPYNLDDTVNVGDANHAGLHSDANAAINDMHVRVNAAGLSTLIPPSGKRVFLTRDDNNGALMGNTLGTEYGIGMYLPAMTIAGIGLIVDGVGTAGSVMLVGIRPVTPAGAVGSPVAQVSISLAATGDITSTVSATIAAGLYAISWCRIGDTGNTARFHVANLSQQYGRVLVPLAVSTGAAAWGHGPTIGVLNTGITSAPLPSTASLNDVGGNQEGNSLPAIELLG